MVTDYLTSGCQHKINSYFVEVHKVPKRKAIGLSKEVKVNTLVVIRMAISKQEAVSIQ